MDRYDESKHVDSMRPDDEVRSADGESVVLHDTDRDVVMKRDSQMPDESDMPKRQGDILGLGGSVVPKSSEDPSTEYDAESVTQRRTRSLDMDEPASGTDMPRTKGATGIDMGSGGSGTDLE